MADSKAAGAKPRPGDPVLAAYIADLERRGYSRWVVAHYTRVAGRLLRAAGDEGGVADRLPEDRAVQLVRRAAGPGAGACRHDAKAAKHFARYVAGRAPAGGSVRSAEPSAPQLGYEDHLRRQRGLAEASVYANRRIAARFVEFRFGDAVPDFAALSARDVAAFLGHATAGRTPYRDKTLASHLRNFCLYLFRAGLTAANLAPAVPSVAQRHGARLPRHLAPEQVEAVVAAAGRAPLAGRRNRAMVLLQARLGLRAPEVVAIRLRDVDWRAGELLVRGKGAVRDRLPLPPDVGEAVADYLRHERRAPPDRRHLFVRHRAPHMPFKDGQVLNGILLDALARAGIKPPSPYVGSHLLRHSLAVGLIRRGATIGEVADVLRHRGRASTLIYARFDVEGLRDLALPWPAAEGAR